MKKEDDKWAGPYEITAVYPRACAFRLFMTIKIFPVFHMSLFLPLNPDFGRRGQKFINEAELKKYKRTNIHPRERGKKRRKNLEI
jgi:hypothetical protein